MMNIIDDIYIMQN